MKTVPVSKRIKRLVEKHSGKPKFSDCWLLNPTPGNRGYAKLYVWNDTERKRVRAHRASYEAFIGPIPEGLIVCHKCDVRNCVNPKHLFIGTQKDNMQDMISKKRNKTK